MTGAVETLRLRAERLRHFASRCLQAVGVPIAHADAVADNLIDADLRGVTSHGVARLIKIYVERLEVGVVDGRVSPSIIRESSSTALVDAHNGLGAVAAGFATGVVIGKARNTGAAWAGVAHSNHFGACSYYTNRIAGEGMVGIVFTNAPPTMAPWGGIEPRLGTNPIAVAVPTGERTPLSVDIATSVVARGHLLLAATKGEAIPAGWAQDRLGRPTTDADEGLAGTVLPMGGHKGYALAFVIDIITGILTGSAFGQQVGQLYGDLDHPQAVGSLFGAIDIGHFVPLERFYDDVAQAVRDIKSSPTAPWADEILVPGELEARARSGPEAGWIPIPAAIHRELSELGARLHVPLEE